jgi:hypothetical protein
MLAAMTPVSILLRGEGESRPTCESSPSGEGGHGRAGSRQTGKYDGEGAGTVDGEGGSTMMGRRSQERREGKVTKGARAGARWFQQPL